MLAQSLLLTDLDRLAMLKAYAAHGMAEPAVFELFVRNLPPERGAAADGARCQRYDRPRDRRVP